MMTKRFIFTSESVTAGHPDKLCDQISDAVVDHVLSQDPHSDLVCQSAIANGVLFIAASLDSSARVDMPEVAREVMRHIGYPEDVFNADACTILTTLNECEHNPVWDLGLSELDDQELNQVVATNQVMVFGYACNQNDAMIPTPIWLAHRMVARMDSQEVREAMPYLLPDGKAQVSVDFRNDRPKRIHGVMFKASQVKKGGPDAAEFNEQINKHVIQPVLNETMPADEKTQILVNPGGPFYGGGPAAHPGQTGRKTGADTYGNYARNGGTALSGKGPTHIERAGAYLARFLAKNVVAAGLAKECEIQISYAFGQPGPDSLRVRTNGTNKVENEVIHDRLMKFCDMRLGAIVRDFNLRDLPRQDSTTDFYRRLAVYGHMGRTDMDVPWEDISRAKELKKDV
jgi:S-adenosylmethionine synthetase